MGVPFWGKEGARVDRVKCRKEKDISAPSHVTTSRPRFKVEKVNDYHPEIRLTKLRDPELTEKTFYTLLD